MRFRLGRAAELDVKAAHLVADLPVPRAVVLDLPEEVRAGLRVFEQAHRQVFLCRPVADVRRADDLGGALHLLGLAQREAELREAVALPLHFALPPVVRVPDAHLVVGGEQALLLDAGQREGRDVLEALRLLPDIRHVRPAAHGLDAVVKLHVGDGVDAADVVVHLDFELAAEAVALVRKIDELHAVAGRGRDVLVAVALEGAVLAGDHDLEQVVALGIDLGFRPCCGRADAGAGPRRRAGPKSAAACRCRPLCARRRDAGRFHRCESGS